MEKNDFILQLMLIGFIETSRPRYVTFKNSKIAIAVDVNLPRLRFRNKNTDKTTDKIFDSYEEAIQYITPLLEETQ
jgi:hypothetical protein